MHARFLLGPAGSGKTFRCLAEIRAELATAPAGPPLLLLAPKQATAQLERQLLADSSLNGYTRLQILSFDRLAQFILAEASPAAANWLDDEGRVMVLRALLAQKKSELKVFPATARLPGFATRLSNLLRELQRSQISPQHLTRLAEKKSLSVQLRDKLHDFALLLDAYRDWLTAQNLHDADTSLDAATALLQSPSSVRIAGLWLDGFAEMTAQELDLLAALIPHCERATLAFCLEAAPQAEPSWRSPWAVVGQTYLRCHQRLKEIPGNQVTVEVLPRNPQTSRFHAPALAALESNWSHAPNSSSPSSTLHPPSSSLHLAACATPEAEANRAAREILRHVRAGGRYRDCAILVRALDGYADTLRRVFARYEIPHFLDRREAVAHHPLAELTRSALRTVAYGWRPADWFGALKTGLVPASENEIDWLENAALEYGWDGNYWRQPFVLTENPAAADRAEPLRKKIIPPFLALAQATAAPLTGPQLAAALRELWSALDAENTLERWSTESPQSSILNPQSSIHQTVWEQLQQWLDNLERAFPATPLPIRDWLPILEAGLATLTVGVIPPALDQVLIGAIDRSRNPELKLACVLGLNEGTFPAPPAEDPLLNELERDALNLAGAKLAPGTRHRLGHEWFYGYIACTRASEKLLLTCAQTDARGNALHRSAFLDHIEKIFPGLKTETWQPPAPFTDILHPSEIITPALQLQAALGAPSTVSASRSPNTTALLALPELQPVLTRARDLAAAASDLLPPAIAEQLYTRELPTSISALEDFAACPFKFFIARGLRAQARKQFELDARERGSFQHEVLTRFHNELAAENLRWRDLTPADAQKRVRRIGSELLASYRAGLFTADATRRFSGELLLGALETLIAVLVGWARDYKFDPALVEVGFGLPDAAWPALRVPLAGDRALLLRGRIDRVDVFRNATTDAALAIVVDYKSSSRKPDRTKLHHGLQLQLPTYLAVLEKTPAAAATLGAKSLTPAGVFYVNLRGEFAAAASRTEALADPATALRESFQHAGRYDEQVLAHLDPRGTGEQFKTHRASHDRMDAAAFRDLLDRAVANLRRFGDEIFSGGIAPAPFRKGSETACDFCDYASVCRFDAWTQPFRPLAAPPKAVAVEKPATKPARKKTAK